MDPELSGSMEQVQKLEALGIALLDVVRDSRYHEDLRATLRIAYDSVEEAVCRMQIEVTSPFEDRNSS
jgi:hypothetical protein